MVPITGDRRHVHRMPVAVIRARRRSDWLNRDRILHVLPFNLIEHPFEVLLAAYALISGVPLLLGITSPSSLTKLLPLWGVKVWAGALCLGGATITVGLRKRWYYTTVPSGLSLLGAAFTGYGIAVFTSVGFHRGWSFGTFLFTAALTCAVRGFYLVQLGRNAVRIRDSSAETERLISQREAHGGGQHGRDS